MVLFVSPPAVQVCGNFYQFFCIIHGNTSDFLQATNLINKGKNRLLVFRLFFTSFSFLSFLSSLFPSTYIHSNYRITYSTIELHIWDTWSFDSLLVHPYFVLDRSVLRRSRDPDVDPRDPRTRRTQRSYRDPRTPSYHSLPITSLSLVVGCVVITFLHTSSS